MTDETRKVVCNEENSPPLPAELCCTSQDKDALLAAVYNNDAATFDYLVKHNVDLNCQNRFGETPLLIGIKRNGSNCQNRFSETPLVIGIKCDGSNALIERLLDLGCDINITDEYRQTPLHVAILNGNVEISQKLIELGADLDVQDLQTRETPLFYAIKNNNIEAVCMLLCYGADVTIKNSENYTPLTYAVDNYRQDVVLILLDYCDEFNYRDNDGYTPLHWIVAYGSDVAIRLIDAGADVNGFTKDGYCALEFAMDLAGADVFKKIWGRMNIDVVLETRFPVLLTYIKSVWRRYSANEWVECLYLMLESPIAVDLIDQCTVYCASLFASVENTFITELLYSLKKQNVTSRDRQNIINICVTLGAQVTVNNLDAAIEFFGYKEEFETLVYASEHYRNEDIHHPLLPLIIGLSDFNFLKMIQGCSKYLTARPSQEEELVNNIIVSCVGFFSITPFWKQELLYECEWISRSEYDIVGKIKAACEFPSLLELSRNKVHSVVRKMCKAKKPYQFHDAVKSLPLPGAIIDFLLFKRPIYKEPDWVHTE